MYNQHVYKHGNKLIALAIVVVEEVGHILMTAETILTAQFKYQCANV